MTRTDPPPRRSRRAPEGGTKGPQRETSSMTPETEELDTGWEEEAAESVELPIESIDIPVDMEGDQDEGEITTGETEVSLEELGLGPELEPGDDPCPSPFDRPTIVPPIPEHEYVAQMMRELPESERLPISRSLTPRASLAALIPQSITQPPISSRPTPEHATPPLPLDFSDH